MDSDAAIATLQRSELLLRARGVSRAAIFGSVARGDNRHDSDIDIMIVLDEDADIGVFEYVGIKELIATLFEQSVDVVNRDGLKPHLRPGAIADARYAF